MNKSTTLDLLYKNIEDYNYMSFDIFDTLLFRNVPGPYDQLEWVPVLMKDRYNITLKNYSRKRYDAEMWARKLRDGKEVDMNMIYDNLPYDGELRTQVMQAESDVEIACCIANRPMVNFLKYCQSRSKKIVIITDIYLERHTIEAMLKKIDVSYDFLFLSSEEGVTKRSGDLFDIVIGKLGIKRSEILHTGDDINNDIEQPRRKGIASLERFVYPGEKPAYFESCSSRNLSNKYFNTLLINGLKGFDNVCSEVMIGYTLVGPMIYDFCQWLKSIKDECRINKLLFTAREGFLIKEIYDILYPEDKESTGYVRLNKKILETPLKGDSIQVQLLKSYLSENNFVGQRVGLVNNSINGTGQSMLEEFMNTNMLDHDIVGLQFFKSDTCSKRLAERCRAFLSDSKLSGFKTYHIWQLCLLFEHLLFEPEGTAVCLNKDNGLRVKCEIPRKEQQNFKTIKSIQGAAIQFVKDYSNSNLIKLNYVGFKSFCKFLSYPRQADAKLICELWDDDEPVDKQISDLSLPLKKRYILGIDLPTNIIFAEGYLSAKGIGHLGLLLYHVRRFYNYLRFILAGGRI